MTAGKPHSVEQKRWQVRVEFKRQDAWIGVFWRSEHLGWSNGGILTTWWVCLVPCVPIVIQRRSHPA